MKQSIVAAALAAVLTSACGDGTGPARGARIEIAPGQPTRTVPAGTALPDPLVVLVTDARGMPLSGASVEWVVAEGGGSVSEPRARTDANGFSVVRWELGPVAGRQAVVARLSPSAAVTFEAIVVPAAPVLFTLVFRSHTFESLGDSLRVPFSARDAFGNEQFDMQSLELISRDTTVVRAGPGGMLRARGNGMTTVLARLHGLTDSMTVEVRQVPRALHSSAGTELAPGDVSFLQAVDAGGSRIAGAAVLYSSSAPAVLRVSPDGRASALATGTAVVTASVAAGTGAAPVTLQLQVMPASANRVSTGGAHSCMVDGSGSVFCWGLNDVAQLGSAATGELCTPANIETWWPCTLRPTRVPTNIRFASVATGFAHTCGLTDAGEAYCWGRDTHGQLGAPSAPMQTCNMAPWAGDTVPCSRTPVRVETNVRFASLSAGHTTTCGLTAAGVAYCWGGNFYGQAGVGERSHVVWLPAPVVGGHRFRALDSGGYDSCGLTHGGELYCWGSNFGGALGDGTTDPRAAPVAVSGGLRFDSFSTGREHSCGLTTSGAAYCWGVNTHGQLGADFGGRYDGFSAEPMRVLGGHTFRSIHAAHFQTCGRLEDSTLMCWGSNMHGQFGVPQPPASPVPVPAASGLAFRWFSAGTGGHACGVRSTGALYCWGSNDMGAAGTGATDDVRIPARVNLPN